MPYRNLPDIAIADTAFEATGETREALFAAAADAVMSVMVDDLGTIGEGEVRNVRLTNDTLDLLLLDFLEEFIFFKDSEQLLLRPRHITIFDKEGPLVLEAVLSGERMDPEKHAFKVDVKAVTLHMFEITKTDEGWKATVVLDV
ncbi:MAG TPA: archease [Syntrophorhabdaceae bacterium]